MNCDGCGIESFDLVEMSISATKVCPNCMRRLGAWAKKGLRQLDILSEYEDGTISSVQNGFKKLKTGK